MHTPRFIRTDDGGWRPRRRFGPALVIGLAVAMLTPGTALAQTDGSPDDETPTDPNGDAVTTMWPDTSLDVSGFSPECVGDTPFVSYSIVPVGFVADPPEATLVISGADGTRIDTRQVSSLSGRFIWPGASVDAGGNATDWPGWQRAGDGVSWIPDQSDAFLREVLTIDVTVDPTATATATATVSYPPTNSPCDGPAERALDVSAFAPVCITEAPFIEYAIETLNFESSGPATLTFFDRNGHFVDQRTVTSLSGRTIHPGASVDANGVAIDWPGWKRADDGVSWIPDESDAVLREALTIQVTIQVTVDVTAQVDVDPTATTAVSYPSADAPCANPPGQSSPPTTVCEPGRYADGTPADDCTPACVPTQNSDANPADDCTLPRTGGDHGNAVILGVGAFLVGLLFLLTAQRRRQPDGSPSAS